MPCRITVRLRDGRVLTTEKRDYEGFLTHPMGWETVVQKFERLSSPYADAALRREIIDAVAHLESIEVSDLTRLLAQVQVTTL
jgi:2-methylcitrate dehydratase